MAYRSVTHCGDPRHGTAGGRALLPNHLGLQVAFREAGVADVRRTLPVGAEWEDAEAAGIPLSMCFLTRDGFRLALEEAPNLGPDQGKHSQS